MKRSIIFAALCAWALSQTSTALANENYNAPAHFKVATEVVNPNLQPFTATIGGVGNSLINAGAGFEPVVFRTRLMATEDSPDRIIAKESDITNWDTLREGALDGATVQVYRIAGGQFQLVREDQVAAGGSAASGWLTATPNNTVIPAGQTNFQYHWQNYNRPGTPNYFAVRSIDNSGNVSDFSNTVTIERPPVIGKSQADNSLVPLQATSSFLDPTPPAAPSQLRVNNTADGSLSLEWTAVDASDLAGYQLYRSDYPPERHKGYYLQLAKIPETPSQHIRKGDMVIVSKKFYSASRKRFHTNRVWGAETENRLFMPGLVNFFPDEDPDMFWELVPHPENTPVSEPGETFIRLKLNTEKPVLLGMYNHAGTDQDWYDVLEPKTYRVEAWIRHEGNGRVQFKLPGFFNTAPNIIQPIEFKPGREWQKFAATFTPPTIQPGKRANQMALEFTGPGTFEIDNFRVFKADTAYLDYSKEEYFDLKSSNMRTLRTHGFIKTGRKTYDMEQFTNTGGVISGTSKLNTLPQTLAVIRNAGMLPWLQIEPHMTPTEWQAFVEYMSAPYSPPLDTPQSKPWAYKRYLQGQQRPWADEFEQIFFEIGNETWNSLFRPWTFEAMTDSETAQRYSAGQVYGLFQEHVHRQMSKSPYWSTQLDQKLVFVLGGWNGFDYGAAAASNSPSSDYMTVASYNGGWDEAEGPPSLNPASYFNVLNQNLQVALPNAIRHSREVQNISQGDRKILQIGTYEAGPGYALNGLNNARVTEQQAKEQELVMKSLAAGTATIDSFLTRAYLGYSTQNFFTFGQGNYWKSHAQWHKGRQAYPSWNILSAFNQHATGDLLVTEAITAPTTDLPATGRRAEVRNAEQVAIYATRKEQRLSLIALSRKVPDHPYEENDGFTPTTVELPIRSAKSLTLYRMSGVYDLNNTETEQVKIEKIQLPQDSISANFKIDASHGANDRGLPPAATFIYIFDGAEFQD